MDRDRISGDEFIAAVFEDARAVIDYTFARLKLTEQELEELRQDLKGWFLRFGRRSGELPVGKLSSVLTWAALRLATQVAEWKGIELDFSRESRDLEQIARDEKPDRPGS